MWTLVTRGVSILRALLLFVCILVIAFAAISVLLVRNWRLRRIARM